MSDINTSRGPVPPGWYVEPGTGHNRWWDGTAWGAYQTVAPAPAPVQPNVRQSRDRAQYTREQKGHSIVKHILLGWIVLWIPTIYYSVSPNHYWHL